MVRIPFLRTENQQQQFSLSARSSQPESDQPMIDNLEEVLLALPLTSRRRCGTSWQPMSDGALIEIVMDLGRRPEARFQDSELYLSDHDVTRDDLQHVVDRIGVFGDDNRAGIERTLHRISAIRNRTGAIVGLTCRIGRAVYGTIAIIRDLVESGAERPPARPAGRRQDDDAARSGARARR